MKKSEQVTWPDGTSPYPGLEWFDQDYAPLFFGRDREVTELVGKLSEPGGRFLIISGASGSGKSSFVAAGLWRALMKEGRLPGSQAWKWLRITPAADNRGPFASLAAGVHHLFPKVTARMDDLARGLASDPTAFLTHIIPQLSQGQDVVLFVDQLEELFTQAFPSVVGGLFAALNERASGLELGPERQQAMEEVWQQRAGQFDGPFSQDRVQLLDEGAGPIHWKQTIGQFCQSVREIENLPDLWAGNDGPSYLASHSVTAALDQMVLALREINRLHFQE